MSERKNIPHPSHGELFYPDSIPFNLAGELIDNATTAEGEARVRALAESEARKAQIVMDLETVSHIPTEPPNCPNDEELAALERLRIAEETGQAFPSLLESAEQERRIAGHSANCGALKTAAIVNDLACDCRPNTCDRCGKVHNSNLPHCATCHRELWTPTKRRPHEARGSAA